MQKRLEVDVRISEHHVQRVSVFPWEVAILDAIHVNVPAVIVAEKVIDREMPDVDTEFGRLGARYGRAQNEDGSPGAPYVEVIYGANATGRQALARAMKEVEVPEGTAASLDDLLGQGDTKGQSSSVGG